MVLVTQLTDLAQPQLPVEDLLGWLVERHPGKDTAQVLAGFTELIFDTTFQAAFTDRASRGYTTADGSLEASPVQLISA